MGRMLGIKRIDYQLMNQKKKGKKRPKSEVDGQGNIIEGEKDIGTKICCVSVHIFVPNVCSHACILHNTFTFQFSISK